MARPKSYFPGGKVGRKAAIKASKAREVRCHKFTRQTRSGKDIGFYVGDHIPIRLENADLAKVR